MTAPFRVALLALASLGPHVSGPALRCAASAPLVVRTPAPSAVYRAELASVAIDLQLSVASSASCYSAVHRAGLTSVATDFQSSVASSTSHLSAVTAPSVSR